MINKELHIPKLSISSTPKFLQTIRQDLTQHEKKISSIHEAILHDPSLYFSKSKNIFKSLCKFCGIASL